MLKLYDANHIQMQPLTNYEGLCLTQEVSGEDVLSFTVPRTVKIEEEWYVRTKDNEYVIKEKVIDTTNDNVKITAKINVEDLKGTPVKLFVSETKTPTSALSLAFTYAPNSWTIHSSISKQRTIRLAQCSVWDIVQEAIGLYMAEIRIDAINHKIYMESHLGEDKGVFFIEDLNLTQLIVSSDTYELCTVIYPVGKDGLTIGDVNGGLDYVKNNTWTDKSIGIYWEDNRYTVAENLRDDAIEKLETLSQPAKSYSCSVIDMAALKDLTVLDFNVGDTVTIMSKTAELKEKHRIVSIKRYLDEPEKTTCTLSTQLVNLADYMSQSLSKSDVVALVTTSDGRIDPSKVDISGTGALPAGGQEGMALVKKSDADGDVVWKMIEGGDSGLTFEEIEAIIQIGTNDIQDGAITNAKIGVAAIGVANIAEGAITNAKIQNGAINNAKIEDATITGAKIKGAEIDGAHIKNATIDTSHLLDAIITTAKIKDLSVTNAKLADAAITSAKIQDAAIDTAKIHDAAITSAKIAEGAITSAKIGEATILAANIQDGAITNAKIALGAIDTANIKDATITSAKIAEGAIGSAQISELSADLITSGTLQTERLILTGYDEAGNQKSIVYVLNEINGSMQPSGTTIDGNSITGGTITGGSGGNIGDSTITGGNIAGGTIVGGNIAGSTITGDNIAAVTITGDHIKAGSISSDKIIGKSLNIGLFSDATVSTIVGQANDYTDKKIDAVIGQYLNFTPSTGLTIGEANSGFSVNITNEEIGFYSSGQKVAHMDNDDFVIQSGMFTDYFGLENWVFSQDSNGNFSITWRA